MLKMRAMGECAGSRSRRISSSRSSAASSLPPCNDEGRNARSEYGT